MPGFVGLGLVFTESVLVEGLSVLEEPVDGFVVVLFASSVELEVEAETVGAFFFSCGVMGSGLVSVSLCSSSEKESEGVSVWGDSAFGMEGSDFVWFAGRASSLGSNKYVRLERRRASVGMPAYI